MPTLAPSFDKTKTLKGAWGRIDFTPAGGAVNVLSCKLFDADGKLSFKEVVMARMAYFEAADTNDDDRLSMRECIDHQRKMAGASGKARKYLPLLRDFVERHKDDMARMKVLLEQQESREAGRILLEDQGSANGTRRS